MGQYIDKSAVVAEIERKKIYAQTLGDNAINISMQQFYDGMVEACDNLLNVLDTLEVKAKEVDFERELSKYVSHGIHRFFPNVNDDYCKMDSVIWQDYVIETAKHFYELGIQQSKGE